MPVLAVALCNLAGGSNQSRFLLGGGLALLVLVLLRAKGWHSNPLLLGGNLFMLLVAATYALYLASGLVVPGLVDALMYLRESGWFLMLLAVGVAMTLASPRGYVGVEETVAERGAIRRASWLLLAATLVGLALSHVYRGQESISIVLPVTALFLLQRALKSRLAKTA